MKRRPPPAAAPLDASQRGPSAGERFVIVGVGASAGGLDAFTDLLTHLPLDTGMAFVLVQHLDPLHESALTALLARATEMPVQEITQGLRVEPNCVYVIPPNVTLSIKAGVLHLEPRAPGRTPHRSVDFFLESLAKDRGDLAVGVILSGSATDGTLGVEAIKAEGGITFAQDDSARYDSMPRSAAAAGCVDYVLNPQQIARELVRIGQHPFVQRPRDVDHVAEGGGEALDRAEHDRSEASAHQDDASALPSGGSGAQRSGARQARAEAAAKDDNRDADAGFQEILRLLRGHSGVDFSLYKSPTIQRRVARRLVLKKHDTLEQYAEFLRGNDAELDALYSDVLVSVTSFFRNPEAFEVLEGTVFPRLLQGPGNGAIRIWTLGCSTGQEAYSIAMAFSESATRAGSGRKLQLFATDLNAALIEKARHGLYAKSIADDLSPERLQRFFVEEQGGYRIVKSLRESVVFARQNLINDPPFSRMDLISCRNLLIYLEPSLQKKALSGFHYALKPDGYLFLGASESIGGFGDLFEPADRKQKIFLKKRASAPGVHLPRKGAGGEPGVRRTRASGVGSPAARFGVEPPEGFDTEVDAQREADRIIIGHYAPPSVLVNADLRIVQFRGATEGYLAPPSGRATFDLLKMVRDGLMLPLRAAIAKAEKSRQVVRKDDVRLDHGGVTRSVSLEVVPLKNLRERHFLVIFREHPSESTPDVDGIPPRRPPAGGRGASSVSSELRRLLKDREAELADTRDYLQSVQEQYEATNAELQSANEEVQSTNEELQSLNEELETSKEELESSNEELTTVNEEMATRNAELTRVNSDLINLQASARFPIVLLGRDLTIRRFSPQAEAHFQMLPADVGRPIGNVRCTLKLSNLDELISDVIGSGNEIEREVQSESGRWWSLRICAYLGADNTIDGAVLVLTDIDDRRRAAQAIAQARDYAESIVRTVRYPLLILSADLQVHRANEAFYSLFKLDPSEVEGHWIYAIGHGGWDVPELRRLMEDVLPSDSAFEDFELHRSFERIGRRSLVLNGRRLEDPVGQPARILLGIEDVTERERGRKALQSAERRQRRVLDSVPQKLFTATADGEVDYFNSAWMKYTGLTVEQLKGSGWVQVVHPDDLTENFRAWRLAITTGEPYVFAHRLRTGDGEFRWHLSHAQPVRDETGVITMWAGSNNDLHEVTNAEQRKDEFLAMLAHELRGPLAPLSSALEIMRRPEAPSDIVQRAGELALKQMQHMSRLIDDLLNISRISTGRLELRRMPVNLVTVAQDAVDNLRPILDRAGHTLTLELPDNPLYVDGDPVRLVQMFSNLLNNASKYTDAPGQILLKVDRHDADARVTVKDNGIGIAAADMSKIFDMFSQVHHSLSEGRGGLGIGLSLVRSLVELHGGRVDAHSDGEGKGSEFTIRLPSIPAPEAPLSASTKERPPSDVRNQRILVVDDNQDTAVSLAILLHMEGHLTAVAHSGPEALQIGAKFEPHVVLLDIGMPGDSGFEIARKIRQAPWGTSLALFAVTGWGQESDRIKSEAAGFDRHFVKPVDHAELSEALLELSTRIAPR